MCRYRPEELGAQVACPFGDCSCQRGLLALGGLGEAEYEAWSQAVLSRLVDSACLKRLCQVNAVMPLYYHNDINVYHFRSPEKIEKSQAHLEWVRIVQGGEVPASYLPKRDEHLIHAGLQVQSNLEIMLADGEAMNPCGHASYAIGPSNPGKRPRRPPT